VFALETAAHASGTAALLPMLALGIPGSGTAAILLGGLMVGSQSRSTAVRRTQGFRLGSDRIDVSRQRCWSGSGADHGSDLRLDPAVPFAAIAPMIVVSCAIGAYAIQNAMFDIWLMLLFGRSATSSRRSDSAGAVHALALVLGSRAEDAFRLAMIGSGGSMKVFWSNGLVGTITTLAIVLLFWPVIDRILRASGRKRVRRGRSDRHCEERSDEAIQL
jgi:TctA family transporter